MASTFEQLKFQFSEPKRRKRGRPRGLRREQLWFRLNEAELTMLDAARRAQANGSELQQRSEFLRSVVLAVIKQRS